ncbi:glutathione S-transferase theta-3-like [Teleopsis dalmanni]|uniref:glutathione S-transferase theta-3-like n=1 Tax=Teleopsis dalmanni TaxID=139649 RepID=UPI0018CCF874|nr:glutathione S-transferase theta-3-like [Teleopsis dalmanni]
MPESKAQFKYYFDFLSQPSRALYIILKQSGTPFEENQINLLEGGNQTIEFKNEVNRFQKVPAIVEGNFKLAESIAILRYFSNKNYIAEHFYPKDVQKRARVDEFLQWQHNGIRTSCSLYFRFLWVQDKFFGAPAAPGKVAKYKSEMERDLGVIETVWLKDTKFINGNELTAADVFGACEVEQIRTTAYDVGEKFPKVAKWIETVRKELEPHFDFAHQTIYKYEKETKSKL